MASPKRERALTATIQSATAKWKRRAAADRTHTAHLPTLGSGEHCWCGLPRNHDWPGQSDGTPHPRTPRGQL